MKLYSVLFIVLSCLVYAQYSPEKIELTGNLRADSRLMAAALPSTNMTMPVLLPKEKKSPLLAGVLSAVLPGAGQYYNEDYVMTGVFALIEAAAITTAVVYTKKGDDKTDEFEKLADSRWSVVKYAEWLNKWKVVKPEDVIDISTNTSLPPWERVNWDKLNALENKTDGFSHKLARHGEQQYYEMIGKYHQFTAGWDEFDNTSSDNNTIPAIYHTYSGMRGKANDYYDISYKVVIGIYLNHLASVVHSVWQTINYNKSLDISSEVNTRTMFGVTDFETRVNLSYAF